MSPLERNGEALVVIDMQRDFCEPGGALSIGGAMQILHHVNRAIACAREAGMSVIFTKDMHAAEDPEFSRFPPHCQAGTRGAEFVDGLEVRSEDIVVEKPSFSAFFRTCLEESLRERGIRILYLAGVALDCCIMHTTADAVMRGYETWVITDATSPITPEGGECALRHMAGVLSIPLLTVAEFEARMRES